MYGIKYISTAFEKYSTLHHITNTKYHLGHVANCYFFYHLRNFNSNYIRKW
jgi:hypothetical protein